jgi:hypothetical protein
VTRADGIAETISDCLSARSIELPDDVLQQLAEDIDHGIVCWNEMSYGHVSNPLEAEVKREQAKVKEAEKDHDKERERWRRREEDLSRDLRAARRKIEDAYRKGYRE